MPIDGFDALFEQAKTALRDRKIDEAISLLEQAKAIRPDDHNGFDGLATAYFMKKDFANAIINFTRVTLLRPRDAKAFINLGALLNLTEDYKKAIDALRKALQRDPKSADAYYNLGLAERKSGQIPNAINSYRECVRLKPDMPEAHLNLANCYVEQKQFKKAVEQYQHAVDLRPDLARAKRGLQHAKTLLEESRNAMSPFGRLVDAQKIHKKDEYVQVSRALTDEERFADRQLIQLATDAHNNATEGMLKHLREHLEPSLLHITRVLLQNADRQAELFDHHEDFQQSLQYAKKLFGRMKAQVDTLRDHEAELRR